MYTEIIKAEIVEQNAALLDALKRLYEQSKMLTPACFKQTDAQRNALELIQKIEGKS